MRFLAAIVTYNPDPDRLLENIAAIRNQVDAIAIFNNGPSKLDYLSNVTILDEGSNMGIAFALNALCKYASLHEFDWILTLDQDSVAPPSLINNYYKYLSDPTVALLCPSIQDRNYGRMTYDYSSDKEVEIVDACITSGSLLRLSAWETIDGFWEELFIDMVDFDLCWSLEEAGYKILRVNNQTLLQEIGKAKKVRLFGKENVIYNHNPKRCYFIIRNTIAVGRKHNRIKQCWRWVIKRILLINLFESNRWSKDKMMAKGIIDGLRFKI